MKKGIFLFVSFLFSAGISLAQNHTIDSLKNELQKAKEDTSKINMINSLASELVINGHYDSAMKYATEAEKMAEKINYKRGIAKAFNVKGVVYDYQGNFPEALKNYFQSLKIREEIGDRYGLIDTYNNIGTIYIYQGNDAEALKNLLSALKISESIESTNKNKKRIASIYVNVGLVYVHQRNYSEALKNYSEALKISKDVRDAPNTARCYLNIGNIYYNQGNYNSALKNYLLTLEIHEDMGNKGEAALSQINIGIVLTKQKKYNEARKYLMNALQRSREIGAKDYLKACYNHLAELAEATGDYKNAYEYHKRYSEVKDSLLNENNNKQIAEMKTKYETEKKDREIIVLNMDKELLNKDKEIQAVRIAKQKAAVKYLLSGFVLLAVFGFVAFRLYNQKRKTTFLQQVAEMETKLLRAQMNPHFIFNSLNSIQSLILENETRLAREYLVTFSRLTRAILEQTRKKSISLTEEVQTIRMYLDLEKLRFNNKFDYNIALKNLEEPDSIILPPLLIQPFVENCIIHGISNKEGKGKIDIEFRKDDDSLLCTIEDDGIGREKSAQIKKNKAVTGNSVATQLARDRIAGMKINGKDSSGILITDLKNEEGNAAGTKVEINIPIS